jgi:hypothetical protein
MRWGCDFEFSVDRRTLVMQGAGTGLVPTLLYRIERRRPEPPVEALVLETLEHAFHAEGRLTVPTAWEVSRDGWGETAEGAVQVGSDLTAKTVRWRRWEAGNPAWVVRVASVCPADNRIECAVNTAPLPGIRAR